MKLNHLLKDVEAVAVKGNKYIDITNISYDSKQLKPGGLFFAIKGLKHNGLDFVDEAIERGAACIVSEENFITYKSVCKVEVKNARKACAIIANNFYEYPSHKINTIGVTGTNGKTTTLYLIDAILRYSGRSCGTIGTISYNIGERRIPAVNTTPSAIMLQMFLSDMVKAGVNYCVMEVSSHSLHQHRVEGIKYKSAIFTNLSNEHLDYHKDIEGYFLSKRILFEMLQEDANAIVNADDDYGKKIIDATKAKILTYAIQKEADVMAIDINSTIKGCSFKAKTPNGLLNIKTPLIGEYNIYNILAAVSFAVLNGIGFKEVEAAVRDFQGAPGRLQRIPADREFLTFVDYAHTDDALRKVLIALKKIAKKKVIVVFGCGGDRDKSKRPRMGKVAAELADFTIITSDNPRSEKPGRIIDDIIKGLPEGFKDYKVIADRRKAIEASLAMAASDDIVLLAGKGHEKYQVLKDTTVAFDDCRIAGEILDSSLKLKV